MHYTAEQGCQRIYEIDVVFGRLMKVLEEAGRLGGCLWIRDMNVGAGKQ